jgi:hypothetical protein
VAAVVAEKGQLMRDEISSSLATHPFFFYPFPSFWNWLYPKHKGKRCVFTERLNSRHVDPLL